MNEAKGPQRAGEDPGEEARLLELADDLEANSRAFGMGVGPYPYERLAILYSKRGDLDSEIAILERFAKQQHAPGVKPPRLMERLKKKRLKKKRQKDG